MSETEALKVILALTGINAMLLLSNVILSFMGFKQYSEYIKDNLHRGNKKELSGQQGQFVTGMTVKK